MGPSSWGCRGRGGGGENLSAHMSWLVGGGGGGGVVVVVGLLLVVSNLPGHPCPDTLSEYNALIPLPSTAQPMLAAAHAGRITPV
jgi:hypothetical protein